MILLVGRGCRGHSSAVDGRQLLISGHVQGVGFRAWATRRARSLGLSGWTRNLRDGRVEIWAEGDLLSLDALAVACESGPESASVSSVRQRSTQSPPTLSGFRTRDDADGPSEIAEDVE